jgi:uncharacterized membrane protein YkvA (DUF1232 family)
VLGYLDDLVIVPFGILLAVKLVPGDLMAEFRAAAVSADGDRFSESSAPRSSCCFGSSASR